MDVLLEIDSLTVSYGGARGLDSVDLVVGRGESVAVVGESGSGKSTLLRSVARLLPPQATVETGRIEFCGIDLLAVPDKVLRSLRGSRIAYVFQNGQDSLDPMFTVGRQLDEVLRAHGRKAAPSWGEELLQKMGIEDPGRVLASRPRELSGGQCQRAAMALALACGPDLLLADEPTGALDSKSATQLLETFDLLNKMGASIVMVTHDAFTASWCSRIVFIKDGRLWGQLRRGDDSRKEFFSKVVAAATSLGSEAGDAR